MKICLLMVLMSALIIQGSSASSFKTLRALDGYVPDNTITSMELTGENKVWVGTLGGLSLYDPETENSQLFSAGDRGKLSGIWLPDDHLWCLALEKREDRGERLWIGTGAGLCSFDGHIWTHYDRKYFLDQQRSAGSAVDITSSPRALLIPEEPFHGIWLAGPEGIFKNDGISWMKMITGIPEGITPTAMAQQDDSIWISTNGAGLFRIYSNGRIEKWSRGSGLISDNVLSIAVRDNGEIWAGTDLGVSVFRNDVWEALTVQGQRNIGQVNALLEDSSFSMWVGTDDGLHHYSNGRWYYYDKTYGGLPSGRIWSLLEVPQPGTGKLIVLIGTAGGGLVRFDGFADQELDIIAGLRGEAQTFMDGKLYQRAADIYRQILERYPEDSESLFKLGQINLLQNQNRSAVDYLLKAMDSKPDNAETYVLASDALRKLGRFRQALTFLKTASSLEPGRLELMIAMANLYLSEKDLGLAAAIYQRILNIDDRNIDAYHGLVSCYEQLGLYFNAINTLEGMRQRYSNNEKIAISLSRLYLRQGLILEATREATRALEFAPNNSDLHRILGQIYIEQNLLEQARGEISLAIRLNPRDGEAYADLATIYYRQRSFDPMYEALDRALNLDRLNAKAYYLKGLIAFNSRDWDTAMSNLETSLALDPGNAWTHYRLGLTYQNLRFLDAAHLSYQKVLVIRPDFPEAQKVRESMRLLEQR